MLRVTIEPSEGVSSEPSFIVTPTGSNHFAQVVTIPIKPLSSHEKVSDFPEGLKTNLLRVKGQFDTNLMNNWLYNILADISVNVISKVPAADQEVVHYYYSKLTDSHLMISLTDGLAEIQSESCIPIAIIKDLLVKSANESGTQLSFELRLEESTLRKILKKIEEEYNRFKEIEKDYKLIGPVEEISHLETADCSISEKYKKILANKEDITAKFNHMPTDLQKNAEIVKSLAKEYLKLKGIRGSDKVAAVEAYLKKIRDSFEHAFQAEQVYRLIVD